MMKDKREMRDAYWMLGIGLLSLALVAMFVHYRRPIELQNELGTAIDAGQSLKARELLSSGVDPAKMPNSTPLLISAVLYCDPATVHALINIVVNVNGKFSEHTFTPLHYAVIHRRSDMVDVLLRNGANVRAEMTDGYTPLRQMSRKPHRFAKTGQDQAILRLLKQAEKTAARTN